MSVTVLNADGSQSQASERGVVAWQAGLNNASVGALLTSSPIVPMGTVEYDTANAYDRTNRRYVAKYAGLYRVSWIVSQGAWLNDNDVWLASLYKNGALFKAGIQVQEDVVSGESSNQTYRKASHGSAQVWLNVGDYIDIRIYSTYGADSTRSYRGDLATYTYWEGELIGAAPTINNPLVIRRSYNATTARSHGFWEQLPFNTTDFDTTGSSHPGNQLMIPRTGIWRIGTYASWSSNQANSRWLAVSLNGSTGAGNQPGNQITGLTDNRLYVTGGGVQQGMSALVSLTAGSLLDLRSYQDSGSVVNVLYCSLTAEFVV